MAVYSFSDATLPVSIARAQSGEVYFHNGDPDDTPGRWDGSGSATASGIVAPTTAPTVTAKTGSGISGEYTCYYRYVDEDGTPSNFSPSAVLTLDDNGGVDYADLVPSTNPRVSAIELWRNTAGQTITYYLDATVAKDATTGTSAKTDDDLRESEAIRFLTEDGYPNANRFTPPPAYMAVVKSYQDRMWFFKEGDTTSSATEHRNLVMFSEAGEPESVPECNTLELQEDGDNVVGGMVVGSYLYLLKRRHIYRLGTAGDPRLDASAMLVAERGCLNDRCWCRVEGVAFVLDENGVYVFDGNSVEPIDTPVRDYLLEDVNWSAEDTFSVAKSADEEVVKVLLAFGTDTTPKNALCYQYRLKQWHLETHDQAMSGSGEAVVDGMSRMLASVGGNVVLMDVEAQENDDVTISYTARFGEFRLLDYEPSNVRRVTIWFTPVTGERMTAKLYYNGSATAATVDTATDNENGVTTTAGSASHVIDLSRSSGCASFRFDAGMDADAATHKTVMLELSGTAWHAIQLHRIEIDGVRV